MRDGLRVYDADTHVNPAAEVLERYVDPSFHRAWPSWPPPDPMGRPQATASGTATGWRRQAPDGSLGRWVHSPRAPAEVARG